ncbi:hypothetical protein BDR03DRAFT_1057099 [Suillus americanus]|nr:hypothetical protein BDR03DRAFT_1057099 [Suillus americanus]
MLERLVRLFRYDIEGISCEHFPHPVISFTENLDFWSEAAPHGGEGIEPSYLSGCVLCVYERTEGAPKIYENPLALSGAEFDMTYVRRTGHPFARLDDRPYPRIDNRCASCGRVHFNVKQDDNFDPELIAGAVGTTYVF